MDDQNDDALLNGPNIHSYSEKFALRSDSDEDSPEFNQKFSSDDASSNYQKAPRIFDRFYNFSSSDDEEDDASGSSTHQRRLDYMLQFLDRKLSSSSSPDQPLPDFAGSGGGTGIYKPPVRAPVHPMRPIASR